MVLPQGLSGFLMELKEYFIYLREQHRKMKPSISIFTTDSRGSHTKGGDLLIGTNYKYLRITDQIAGLLDIKENDYLLLGGFGRDGKTIFMGKRPDGMFGGIRLDRKVATKALHSVSQAAISQVKDQGFRIGKYRIDYDTEPVDEFYDGKKVTWYRLRYDG